VVAKPMSMPEEASLRYEDGSTRGACESKKKAAARWATFTCAPWARTTSTSGRAVLSGFRPPGLIIDVGTNGGGNIDSWILGKLLRKAWFYWQPRIGKPTWNMQYAFRGHLVLLCDEWTGSDGEAFAEDSAGWAWARWSEHGRGAARSG